MLPSPGLLSTVSRPPMAETRLGLERADPEPSLLGRGERLEQAGADEFGVHAGT